MGRDVTAEKTSFFPFADVLSLIYIYIIYIYIYIYIYVCNIFEKSQGKNFLDNLAEVLLVTSW